MKESFYDYVTRIQSFTDDEKEDCQAFDKEEKDRIFCEQKCFFTYIF